MFVSECSRGVGASWEAGVGVTQEEKPPQGPLPVMVAVSSWGFPFFSTSSCSLTHMESFRWESAGEVTQGGASHAALLAAPFLFLTLHFPLAV